MLMAETPLPIEILSDIFRELESKQQIATVALVSRRWASAALPLLWNDLQLFVDDWEAFKSLFRRSKKLFVDYRRFVTRMTIGHCMGFPIKTKLSHFSTVLSGCINLTHLMLDDAFISDDDAWILSVGCPALRVVSLLCGTSHLTDEGVMAFAKNCRLLCGLSLKCISAATISERAIDSLATVQNRLTMFGLLLVGQSASNAPTVSVSIGQERRLEESLLGLVESCSRLQSLSLDWPCDMDVVLSHCAKHLLCLQSLSVGSTNASNALQRLIRANASHLKSVSLSDVTWSLETSLSTLLASLSTSDPFLLDDQHTTGLRSLELEETGSLGDLLSVASSFRNLTRLKLKPSSRSASVRQAMFDDLMCTIAEQCPFLSVLHVPIGGDVALIALSRFCPELTDVDLIDGEGITNQGLVLFVKGCRRIQSLTLGSARSITDVSIKVVASTLKTTLRLLSLPSQPSAGLTISSIEAVSYCCLRLVFLFNIPMTCGSGLLVDALSNLRHLTGISFKDQTYYSNAFGGHGLDTTVRSKTVLSPADEVRLKRSCHKLKYVDGRT